jgi:DNA polymerase-4
VTVKLKYADFQQITRSRSGARPVGTKAMLEQVSLDLLWPLFPSQLGVRLLGVALSSLNAEVRPGPAQLALGLG